MQKLLILRGLPSAGKSTFARAWVAADSENRVRSNRDEVREMMTGKRHGLTYKEEELVTQVCSSLVEAALKAGKSVVVDDTHLRPKYIKPWQQMVLRFPEVSLEIEEMPVLPLEELVQRDASREHVVGEEVITHMYKTFLRKGKYLPLTPYVPKEEGLGIEPYARNTALPPAMLVDLDGTLALNTTGRGWFDWAKVGEDTPAEDVVDMVKELMHSGGRDTVFMSGRDEVCREETAQWIYRHLGSYPARLYMRPEGDQRPDTEVKLELFNRHVRDRFNVQWVIDDRPSVCRMWRKLGLTVLQVGDPHVEF